MAARQTTKAVTKREPTIAELVELQSWDGAIEFLTDQGIEVFGVDTVEEFLGDGFAYVMKTALVNIPFVVLKVDHSMSPTYDVPMTTIRAMTATNKRVKFVDFSTGVHSEISSFEQRSGKSAVGLLAKGGLAASTYDVCEDCGMSKNRCTEHPDGKTIKATTYRLNLEG